MKAILAGVALLVTPIAAMGQVPVAPLPDSVKPAITAGACYIQIPKLAAPPPAGIAELGAAIRALDAALKPQVDEVNRLRGEVMQLLQRQRTAMQDENSTVDLAKLDEDVRARTAELESRLAALRADYATRQTELFGPVQDKIGRVAVAYGKQHGCTALKMARTSDLDALTAAQARDITDGFLAFYAGAPR